MLKYFFWIFHTNIPNNIPSWLITFELIRSVNSISKCTVCDKNSNVVTGCCKISGCCAWECFNDHKCIGYIYDTNEDCIQSIEE